MALACGTDVNVMAAMDALLVLVYCVIMKERSTIYIKFFCGMYLVSSLWTPKRRSPSFHVGVRLVH
jgi:hypothetical protein